VLGSQEVGLAAIGEGIVPSPGRSARLDQRQVEERIEMAVGVFEKGVELLTRKVVLPDARPTDEAFGGFAAGA